MGVRTALKMTGCSVSMEDSFGTTRKIPYYDASIGGRPKRVNFAVGKALGYLRICRMLRLQNKMDARWRRV
jgi:hypothetical protein